MNLQSDTKVKVIWDLDNCSIPPSLQPVQVVRSLDKLAYSIGKLESIIAFGSVNINLQQQLLASKVILSKARESIISVRPHIIHLFLNFLKQD